MADDRRVRVELGDRAYDVVLATGGLEGLTEAIRGLGRRAVLVTDDTVAPLWGDAAEAALREAGLGPTRVVLPAGEANKTLATWADLVGRLLALRVDRRTLVVALGGGVVGDMAGFAAAATMRGLPFVQVPTTLLAMVDSSVGGKTGVNHPLGKNLVGAFHQPELVYAAMGTLATLPAGERAAGLGEVVKTALVGDAPLLDHLEAEAEAIAEGDPAALVEVVARCIRVKAAVVAADEREAGWRAVLNAGHTVGHALEAACGFGTLRHGEAVGLGLVAETRWAVREGLCEDPSLPDRIERLNQRLGLPIQAPSVPPETLVDRMSVDKKGSGDILTLPVPVRAGAYRLVRLPLGRLAELVTE